jgi:hypothetical protein
MAKSSSKTKEVKITQSNSKPEKKVTKLNKIVWLTIAATFLLLIANSAIWVNQQIFNSDNFTETVTTSLTSESSREAIASQVTDKIFEDKPVAKRLVGNFSDKLISGLLATDQFDNVLNVAVEKLQVYATSETQEDVEIDLTGIKSVITQVTNVADTLGSDVTVETSNVPDSITLVSADNVPDFYTYGVVLLWLAPISLIGAIILLLIPYRKNWHNRKVTLITQGVIVTIGGLLALLIGPLVRVPLLAQVQTSSGRVVVGNIYDAFIATFNSQTMWIITIGLVAVVVGLSLYFVPYASKYISDRK